MDYQPILEEIFEEVQHLFGQGSVADHIDPLKQVNPNKFGIAIETLDGQCFQLGDSQERFSIQSVSKVFNLALATSLVGDELWLRVGMEPSGNPFNSLVQLEYENGIPRNPFINAGALLVVDVLLDHLTDPNADMLAFVRQLRCSDVEYDEYVAESEKTTGYNNAALVNYMKGRGNIRHEVNQVLDAYCYQCAITMTCAGLARSFLFLANGGVVPGTGQRILSARKTKRMNSIMLTCGFYDESGEFAYKVGMPGKSGVGGGVAAVIPGKLSIAVWSPELNEQGNSVLGIKALELFTTKTGLSIF